MTRRLVKRITPVTEPPDTVAEVQVQAKRSAPPMVARRRASESTRVDLATVAPPQTVGAKHVTSATQRSHDVTSARTVAGAVAQPAAGKLSLDAATVDRLAEDVMQRIDRRLRIERERRGM